VLAQLLPNASSPSVETNLSTSLASEGAGGLGFVPPGLSAAGQLRATTWPTPNWYHVPYSTNGNLFSFGTPTKTVTVTEGGGFAYVPAGSPAFPNPALLMAEWSGAKVAAYDVDMQGDPIPSSRRDFFSMFPAPWGAYFDSETGDYIFLSWGDSPASALAAGG
jgi:hypothetical protein